MDLPLVPEDKICREIFKLPRFSPPNKALRKAVVVHIASGLAPAPAPVPIRRACPYLPSRPPFHFQGQGDTGLTAAPVQRNPFIVGEWTKVGEDIDGSGQSGRFGTSVAFSGDGLILAVGAPFATGSVVGAGLARVFRRVGMSYYQLGGAIEGEAGSDYSGSTVALSADGTTLAVGALANDDGGPDAGHVRVYTWAGVGPTGWTQLGLDIDGEASGDSFSRSISLSADGRTVAIGAHGNDGGGLAPSTGHVQVLRFASSPAPGGGTWTKLGSDIDGETPGGAAGTSVSISADGMTVAVGASAAAGGEVRVSVWTDDDGPGAGRWEPLGQALEGESDGDKCGFSVALSDDGRTLAFGATGFGASTGRVYNFIHVAAFSSWLPVGVIDGEALGEEFGYSLAMSADGRTVSSGARLGATGAGRVGVYQRSGFGWVQLGQSIVGEEANDYSGSSLDLSSDGRSMVVGAHGNNGAGLNAGHVRVFSYAAVPSQPPTTSSPTASDPPTRAPATSSPATAAPVTASPVTAAPVTASPVTSQPSTSQPSTSEPSAAPSTKSPTTSGLPHWRDTVSTAPTTAPPSTAGGNTGNGAIDRTGEGGNGGRQSKGMGKGMGSESGGKGMGSESGAKGTGSEFGAHLERSILYNLAKGGGKGVPKQARKGKRLGLTLPSSTAKGRSSTSSWALLASAFLMTVGVAVGAARRKMAAEDGCYIKAIDSEEAGIVTERTGLLTSPARFRSSPGRYRTSPGRLRNSAGQYDPDFQYAFPR